MRWAKTGSFPTPLSMSLAHCDFAPGPGVPRSLRRTLSRASVTVPSSFGGTIFTPDRATFNEAESMMYNVLDHIPDTGDTAALKLIEADNVSKIVPASGTYAFGYFLNDKYPWIIDNPLNGKVKGLFHDICYEFGALCAAAYDATAASKDYPRSAYHPDNYDQLGPLLKYKKGSSYGSFPYIPGSSPVSGLALMWHIGVGKRIWAKIRTARDGTEVASLVQETMREFGPFGYSLPRIDSMMLLTRARPVAETKPIPIWKFDFGDKTLHASGHEAGYGCAFRDIKPVPACSNIIATGLSQLFSAAVRNMDGFHVGHQVLSPHLLRDFQSFHPGCEFLAHDVKGFDLSNGKDHMEGFNHFIKGLLPNSQSLRAYYDYIDHLPIMTCIPSDTGDSDLIVTMPREYGVSSGENATTAKGTSIHFSAVATAIAILKKMSAKDVLRSCFNFNRRQSSWAAIIKGDDGGIAWKRGWLNSGEFTAAMAEVGFKTDKEPGLLFLMQYIYPDIPMKGGRIPSCPPAFTELDTFKTHGLAGKRVGNRFIFTEHPITDVVIARLATYASLIDLPLHPCYDMVRDFMMTRLSAIDSRQWTFPGLRAYLSSESGKKDVEKAAVKGRGLSPYVNELIRRTFSGDGGFNAASQGELDPAIMSILEGVVGSTEASRSIPTAYTALESKGYFQSLDKPRSLEDGDLLKIGQILKDYIN